MKRLEKIGKELLKGVKAQKDVMDIVGRLTKAITSFWVLRAFNRDGYND